MIPTIGNAVEQGLADPGQRVGQPRTGDDREDADLAGGTGRRVGHHAGRSLVRDQQVGNRAGLERVPQLVVLGPRNAEDAAHALTRQRRGRRLGAGHLALNAGSPRDTGPARRPPRPGCRRPTRPPSRPRPRRRQRAAHAGSTWVTSSGSFPARKRRRHPWPHFVPRQGLESALPRDRRAITGRGPSQRRTLDAIVSASERSAPSPWNGRRQRSRRAVPASSATTGQERGGSAGIVPTSPARTSGLQLDGFWRRWRMHSRRIGPR